tara:strand:- start:38 stop:391 length:354 start_codon:yes stop_codon:yes gene_type:complete
MATWKKFEREIAAALTKIGDRAQRIPVTGRIRGSAPDVSSDMFSIECKYRKEIPMWIKDAMAQAVASSLMDNSSNRPKVPVVFLREKRMPLKNTLVMMRLEDLLNSISLDSMGVDND